MSPCGACGRCGPGELLGTGTAGGTKLFTGSVTAGGVSVRRKDSDLLQSSAAANEKNKGLLFSVCVVFFFSF